MVAHLLRSSTYIFVLEVSKYDLKPEERKWNFIYGNINEDSGAATVYPIDNSKSDERQGNY